MINLPDLALFRTIVEAGGVSAAARALQSSPPAVSRRLAALETRLNVKLVERSSRRFRLTTEGTMLFERSKKILDDLHELENDIGGDNGKARGHLRIAAPCEFGRKHLADVIADFALLHPGLLVQMDVSDAGLEIGDEKTDVILRIGRPTTASTIARKIASSRCVICASPEYIDRRGRPSFPEDLVDHDCLVLARRNFLEDVWCFGSHKIQLKPLLISSSGEVLHTWALSGRGISREAIWDVSGDLATGRLVDVLPEHQAEGVDLFATFAPGKPLASRIRLFIDFLAVSFGGD